MPRVKYVSISIPEELMKEVDEVIKKRVKGYTTRPELIKDAIRDKLSSLS